MKKYISIILALCLTGMTACGSSKASDAGQIITGGADSLFQQTKERGLELFISRLTLALGIIFFVISFILFIK